MIHRWITDGCSSVPRTCYGSSCVVVAEPMKSRIRPFGTLSTAAWFQKKRRERGAPLFERDVGLFWVTRQLWRPNWIIAPLSKNHQRRKWRRLVPEIVESNEKATRKKSSFEVLIILSTASTFGRWVAAWREDKRYVEEWEGLPRVVLNWRCLMFFSVLPFCIALTAAVRAGRLVYGRLQRHRG